ncbi:MAG: Flp pilus assembly protein CpaB [Chloroflexi bacterium]|nr:Flp pilus assembly protein CpaB [Chloroflexota bacterium]
MRNLRPWLMLLLALVSGGLAAYMALRYLRQQASPLMAAAPRAGQVALATRDLAVGTVLTPQDVKLVEWPGNAVPAGYISSADAAVGRGVIATVRTNEALLDSKLAMKEAGGGLPIAVGEGMRALSVRVDDVVSVAGFVVPGTRVDVLLTIQPPGSNETQTRVILQNVATLAAGQQIQRDKDGKPQTVTVITLLVTPEQAERLTLASNQGRIQLALRNTLDTLTTDTPGVLASGLLGAKRAAGPRRPSRGGPVQPVEAAPAPTIIEGYNGGVRTLLKF